jgi:hypothetical protein
MKHFAKRSPPLKMLAVLTTTLLLPPGPEILRIVRAAGQD